MIHVAITGATGFVGSHVLDALLANQSKDIRITAFARDGVNLHRDDDRLRVVRGDMHQPANDLYDQLGRPDMLMHLAWSGLPNYEKSFHFEQELPSQYAFLKTLILAGLPKLLVSGTCFEYGSINGPLSVATPCAQPSSAYAFAKRALHQQLLFLQKDCPFALRWARLFYMYGDRQRHGSLYASLKRAAEQGDAFFSMSSGEQIRDYLSIEDVATQLVKAGLEPNMPELMNVCSAQPVSVRHMAEQWCATHGWQIQLRLGDKPMPAHEPVAFWGVA